VKCRFCGEWLDPSRRPDASAPPAAAAQGHADPPRPADSHPEPWSPPPHISLAPAPLPAASPAPPAPHESHRLPIAAHDSGVQTHRLPTAYDAGAQVSRLPTSSHESPALAGVISLPGLAARPDPVAQHLSSGTGVLAAGPLPPGAPVGNLSPGPGAPPAPRSATSRLADFERSFLDNASDDGDAGSSNPGDDDPFTSQVAHQRPPPPWGLIGAVVGGVALVAIILFKNELFPPDIPTDAADTVAETKAEPPPETKQIKPPPPETKIADTKGLPIQPPPQPTGPLGQAFTDQLARAREAYSEGRLKVAAASLTELAKLAPDHPEVLLLTAQIQLEDNKFTESQKTADRCVFVDPKLADCWLTLGVLRQNNHDNPGAVTAYETYLKLAPTGRYAHDANSQLVRLRPRGAAVPAPVTPAPTTPAPAAPVNG